MNKDADCYHHLDSKDGCQVTFAEEPLRVLARIIAKHHLEQFPTDADGEPGSSDPGAGEQSVDSTHPLQGEKKSQSHTPIKAKKS